MTPFDLAHSPLDPGWTLLDASAGTGKTFAIEGIVLRLVAIEGLRVDQLLVMTFTVAATAELRQRIRRRLAQAAVTLAQSPPGDAPAGLDPALESLQRSSKAERHTAVQRLHRALADFDLATISTIHGFCQLALNEAAPRFGGMLDLEIDPLSKIRDGHLVADFRRSVFLEDHPLLAAVSPPELPRWALGAFRHLQIRPGARLQYRLPDRRLPEVEERLREAIEAFRQAWMVDGECLLDFILQSGAFNKSIIKADKMRPIRSCVRALLGGEVPDAGRLTRLDELTAAELEGHRNKRKKALPPTPQTRTSEAAAELQAARHEAIAALVRAFFDFAERKEDDLKRESQARTYIDLLADLHSALNGPDGKELAAYLGAQYACGLVDEFQDTDPLQWRILQALFPRADEGRRLFLIGDVKQSIYGFRGADINVWIEARQRCSRHYGLGVNYRSEPHLVEAVNHLFGCIEDPFQTPQIPFHPVGCPAEPRAVPLVFGDPSLPPNAHNGTISRAPFVIRLYEANRREEASRTSDTGAMLAAQAVDDALDLLDKASLPAPEARRLLPGDLAFLVRSHGQAALIADACAARGLPFARLDGHSVFETPEARDLLLLLAAGERGAPPGAILSLLASRLHHWPIDEIEAMRKDPRRYEQLLATFQHLAQTWEQRGVLAFMHAWMREFEVLERLHAAEGGTESCCRLRCLAEHLHHAETHAGREPMRLRRWLRGQIEHPERRDPERDGPPPPAHLDAAQILTIHASKGLEFPIVFVPFLAPGRGGNAPGDSEGWSDPETREQIVALPNGMGQPMAPEIEESRKRASRMEEIRLLYVALTRAVYHCRMYLAPNQEKIGGTVGYLLGDQAHIDGIESMVQASRGTIALERFARDESIPPMRYRPHASSDLPDDLRPRPFSATIDPRPEIVSFSLLNHKPDEGHASPSGLERASHHADETERRNLEERAEPGDLGPAEAAKREGFDPRKFTTEPDPLPAGAATGDVFHEVLQHLDWQIGDPDHWRDRFEVAFRQRGLRPDSAAIEHAARLALRAVQTPLVGEFPQALADLQPCNIRPEVEWTIACRGLSPGQLAPAFDRPGAPGQAFGFAEEMRRKTVQTAPGTLRGFIDVWFEYKGKHFILDWKTNLVPQGSPRGLAELMKQHGYYLQASLYALALLRFLRQRPDFDPDRHWGGALYLFVRATGGATRFHPGACFIPCPVAFLEDLASRIAP